MVEVADIKIAVLQIAFGIKSLGAQAFCFGCGFKHSEPYEDCVWNKNPY